MKQGTEQSNPFSVAGDPIVAETERLFLALADEDGSPLLKRAVQVMQRSLHAIRPYEAAFIPDREQELLALTEAFAQRDFEKLKLLLAAYYRRRHELVPEINKLRNRPH